MTGLPLGLEIPAWITALGAAAWLGAKAVMTLKAGNATPSNGPAGEWRGEIRTLIREDHDLITRVIATQEIQSRTIAAQSEILGKIVDSVLLQQKRSEGADQAITAIQKMYQWMEADRQPRKDRDP